DALHALHVAAEVHDGEAVGGFELRDELPSGLLRLLQLEARHRARPVDDEGEVDRGAGGSGHVDAVEVDGDEDVALAAAHVGGRRARGLRRRRGRWRFDSWKRAPSKRNGPGACDTCTRLLVHDREEWTIYLQR